MRIARGRIVKGVGGLYTVAVADMMYTCMARGLFRKDKQTPLVGDMTDIQIIDEDKREGYLHALCPRQNELIRPKAANVDLALIVFAATSPAMRPDLLDSFLFSCEKQGIDAAICINKIDLESTEAVQALTAEYTLAGYSVLQLSAAEEQGLDALREVIQGKTVMFAGPSGVGKSSLINALHPMAQMETGELSRKLARGKHTTRHTELMQLNAHTFIMDSPGFSSLGVEAIALEELQTLYPEFRAQAGRCFYGDCLHVSEPDCAVRKEIGKTVGCARYERYVSFLEKIKDVRTR